MSNPLLTTDACATTAGSGMVTSWTLGGSTTAYAGTLTTTDGYSITASLTWKLLSGAQTTGEDSSYTCASSACAIGTCVQTFDSAGVVVAATVTDDGNNALCHWFLLAAGAVNTVGNVSGSTNAYSIANYLTATQFGTAGASLLPSTLLTTGTTIGTAHGFVRTPATKTTLYSAQAYTQFWYQPTYASTYASTVLRRYNGGSGDADKVKAYCAKMRATATLTVYQSSTALVAATVAGTSGVVTLTGAQALAAGAIAFGAAALAF